MKRLLVLIAVVVAVAGCGGSNNTRDVEGVDSHDPDKIENFNNMDGHPNLGRMCIDGVAFVTSTREYKPFDRVPEWDDWCGTAK